LRPLKLIPHAEGVIRMGDVLGVIVLVVLGVVLFGYILPKAGISG